MRVQLRRPRVPDVPAYRAYRPSPASLLHVSNAISYLSLVFGAMAIATAQSGAPHLAGALLAAAAVADTFDGKFARRFARTPRQARAGGDLDSLVDACVFGMAPVGVMSALAPPVGGVAGLLWWLAAACYLIAVVTRLTFFNLEENPLAFVGVPTPAIALIWSSLLLVRPGAGVATITFAACAVAMVAPLPIPRPRPAGLALFAAWGAAAMVLHVLRAP
ncbi:MAG TPA: CDP-alcohol phosphatidyltransferase family protein [Vicinamibacterales bacterium]|nr:CDP-alcohol phosphatidyltransferase family protein [Vicinamibacterales bacterium]